MEYDMKLKYQRTTDLVNKFEVILMFSPEFLLSFPALDIVEFFDQIVQWDDVVFPDYIRIT